MQALCTSMEVDSSAADECAESDGGALLHAADSGDGSRSAAPLQQPHGQREPLRVKTPPDTTRSHTV